MTIHIDDFRTHPTAAVSSRRRPGEVGPADLWLPPTQPIDITSLVAQQLGRDQVPERVRP